MNGVSLVPANQLMHNKSLDFFFFRVGGPRNSFRSLRVAWICRVLLLGVCTMRIVANCVRIERIRANDSKSLHLLKGLHVYILLYMLIGVKSRSQKLEGDFTCVKIRSVLIACLDYTDYVLSLGAW